MDDPILLFQDWLRRAIAADRAVLPEPTAFTLATATSDGRPSARMLLLKGVDERGFIFYTNMKSRKAGELLDNPAAALCFHWAPLEIQVRVEGAVTGVSGEEADAYFASRPRESQLGAWASFQSETMAEEDDLVRRYAEVQREYADRPVPRPPHWSGFVLAPNSIEFWEGRPHRLHRRRLFTREGETWNTRLLYP